MPYKNKQKEKEWREKHPNYWKIWRENHPDYWANYQCNKKGKFILVRDNFTCQFCGLTQKESLEKFKRRLSIHHKDRNRGNNNSDNLITICQLCHGKLHNKPRDYPKILKLRSSGYTFEYIGNILGVSRQRIHQIVKKNFKLLTRSGNLIE